LLDRFAFIDFSDKEALIRLGESFARADGRARAVGRGLRNDVRERLIYFALHYIERQHRLGLVDDALQARILRARLSFRQFLPARAAASIEFFRPDRLMYQATLNDNLLFGRIAQGSSEVETRINALLNDVLERFDLDAFVIRQGLSREAGPGGKLLSPEQRAMVALARAVFVRPEGIILDGALNPFDPALRATILDRLRHHFEGRTLIVTLTVEEAANTDPFDRNLEFEGARLTEDGRKGSAAMTAGASPRAELLQEG
jgi:putative ABC transport system ATP-binding protein